MAVVVVACSGWPWLMWTPWYGCFVVAVIAVDGDVAIRS
jgi:hypothetical protein